jgi:ligand-binding sensor domain-containing protein
MSNPEKWRDHFSYNSVFDVLEYKDDLYFGASHGILKYNMADKTIKRISKINSLSDIELSAIALSDDGAILIGYNNGNFDILENNVVYNFPDLKNKSMYGSKSINDIFVFENMCYLSTSFGILVFDIINNEFLDTYYIGEKGTSVKVNNILIDSNNKIIAATDNGIYYANLKSSNLADYRNWEKDSGFFGDSIKINKVTFFENKLFAVVKDTVADKVYLKSDNVWSIFKDNLSRVENISVNNNSLIITERKKISVFKENLLPLFYYEIDKHVEYSNSFIDSKGKLWLLDNMRGIFDAETESRLLPNCVLRNYVSDIKIYNDKIWVTQGRRQQYGYGYISLIIKNTVYNTVVYGFSDVMSIAYSDKNEKLYYGSGWQGLVEGSDIYNQEYIFNETNSPLQTIGGQVNIPAIEFDKNDNLWITNWNVKNPLSVKTPSNDWILYEFKDFTNKNTWINTLSINSENQKWIGTYSSAAAIFVFDDNETLDDFSDDRTRMLRLRHEGNQFAEMVFAIAEDKNGTMWLGTNNGIATYSNPSNIFDEEDPQFGRIKLEAEFVDYLLAGNTVTAIAVDGGNRKWIGTQSSGVFLVSENGYEQIKHFNVDNSPLPSNLITSIAINGNNGEVLIGTDKGLISYMGDGLAPYPDLETIKIFPNPIRETYYGDITIDGLVDDTSVKITDVAGNLVFETYSLGGRAIWNGKNLKGDRVSTGVYLVFMANKTGEMSQVSKLLFIN